MSTSKGLLLPPNPLLRHTVSRLLFAVPALSLAACGGEPPPDMYCRGNYTTRTHSIYVLPGDEVPSEENCARLCQEMDEDTPDSCGAGPLTSNHGNYNLTCHYSTVTYCSDGRQPEGLQAPRGEAHCAMGALFARMAWLEAASVPAFLRLADELKRHGAPQALVRAARRAAGEEVRHTRAMTALARRHGAAVPAVEHAPFPARSLEDMVVENAKEGCVRETFGALVAGWQARTAEDAWVREELGRIAEDELGHAELAWAVEAWAAERLTLEAHRRVRDARSEAYDELEQLISREQPDAVLVRQAGLPSRDSALHLLRGLRGLVM